MGVAGVGSGVLFAGISMGNQTVDEMIRAKSGEIQKLKVQIKKMKPKKKGDRRKERENTQMGDMSESEVQEQQPSEVCHSIAIAFEINHLI
eukprot:746579-Hanusia_phi.AAC.3